MVTNTQAVADARHAMTGRDGALYNRDGVLMATVDTFSAKANVSTQQYRPIGTLQDQNIPVTVGVTLTFSQYVVEDDTLIQEFLGFLQTGILPEWNFSGVLKRSESEEERVVYRNCVPNGDIDIQNVTPGELVKRSWTFQCNAMPEMQSRLGRPN